MILRAGRLQYVMRSLCVIVRRHLVARGKCTQHVQVARMLRHVAIGETMARPSRIAMASAMKRRLIETIAASFGYLATLPAQDWMALLA
jgi:hypothetical protein